MARLDWYIRASLTLRHLQLLVALDELRSVGKVANSLFVSQPAVSKMLSGLESGLGVRLFDRTPKGLVPTEHGARMVHHAREMLVRLHAAEEDLRDISEGRITRVSLGVLPASALVLVPRFIVELESSTNDVTVSVREGTMDTLLPVLRNGDIDFLVGVLPSRAIGPEIRIETLYEDPFVVAVRRQHPLAEKRKLVWSDLRGYPTVLPPSGALTRELIVDTLARHEIDIPRRHVESVSTLTTIGVLQGSNSFGLMAREIASYFQALGVLSILPLRVPNIHRSVGLVWRADHRLSAAGDLVRSLFRNVGNAIAADATKRRNHHRQGRPAAAERVSTVPNGE